MKQVVLRAGESRAQAGHPARVIASSEDCDERFCVLESVIAPGDGPAMHVHRRHVEAFYVLDGTLDIHAGPDTVAAPAGSFVFCPAGSPHAFTNPGPGKSRIFGFAAPGGLDRFLAGLGAIFGRAEPPDLQAFDALLEEHDSAPVIDTGHDGPDTTVLAPGEGESISVFGNELTILAGADTTGGAFCLVDYTAGPGFPGPPPHVHHETADMFFIVEGELTMRLGDETLTLGPGAFALVPPETVHTFSNPGDRPVRFLGLMWPGGFEQYFRDLRDAFGDGPPDFARIGEIASRYDIGTAH